MRFIRKPKLVAIDNKSTPTLLPEKKFDSDKDCFELYSAMAGKGCDEEKILDLLTTRSNEQRQELRQNYLRLYNADLALELSKNLGYKFNPLIVGLLMPHYEYLCMKIQKASIDLPAHMCNTVEILMTLNKEQIKDLSTTYRRKYLKSIKEDMRGPNYIPVRRLIKLLVNNQRDSEPQPFAVGQVIELRGKRTNRYGLDIDLFNKYIAEYNFEHTKLIFNTYEHMYGINIEDIIRKNFGSGMMPTYLRAIECIRNPHIFLPKRLHKALQRDTRDCRTLIQIIASRSEYDLGDIRESYQELYGRALFDEIEATTIDCKRALCNLVAGEARDVIYF